MASPQVRVCENLDQLAALIPQWEDLLAHFPGATIFSTWEWLAPWWRAFADGQRLCVAAFFEAPHNLIGLAPFVLDTGRLPGGFRARILKLLGDGSGDSDNLDMPVRQATKMHSPPPCWTGSDIKRHPGIFASSTACPPTLRLPRAYENSRSCGVGIRSADSSRAR